MRGIATKESRKSLIYQGQEVSLPEFVVGGMPVVAMLRKGKEGKFKANIAAGVSLLFNIFLIFHNISCVRERIKHEIRNSGA